MLHAISTSDWHLEGLFNHYGDEGVDMQLSVLESILLYSVERGIKHVFVPGDITDKDKMTDTTKRKLLALLVKYQGIVEIYYIGGNHDRGDKLNTSMDLIASLSKEWGFLTSFHIFMEPEQVVIDGERVGFVGGVGGRQARFQLGRLARFQGQFGFVQGDGRVRHHRAGGRAL